MRPSCMAATRAAWSRSVWSARDRLAEAIQLREAGRAKQDQAILEEARTLLLDLVAAYPDDAEITFQTAVVHDNDELFPLNPHFRSFRG